MVRYVSIFHAHGENAKLRTMTFELTNLKEVLHNNHYDV